MAIPIKKDFVVRNGKILNSNQNIAKMNIFEYIKFDVVDNKFFPFVLAGIAEQYGAGLKYLSLALLNTVMFVFFPITLIGRSFYHIRKAKEDVANFERQWGKQKKQHGDEEKPA